MSKSRVKISFLVLTQRRKEVFLQFALEGFRSKAKLGSDKVKIPVTIAKRKALPADPRSTRPKGEAYMKEPQEKQPQEKQPQEKQPQKKQPQGIDPTPLRNSSVSERKLRANRANALHSTGPKTSRGKKRAARNAVKHGLLATEVVNLDQGESSEDFRDLLRDLFDDYQPVGRTEELLVEKIAGCWWRYSRVLRAENGELSKGIVAVDTQLDAKSDESYLLWARWYLMRVARDLGKIDREMPFVERGVISERVSQELKNTTEGVTLLREVLQQVRLEVEKENSISDSLRGVILDSLGMHWINLMPRKDGGGVTTFDKDERELFFHLIDLELSHLKSWEKHIQLRNEVDGRGAVRGASLPPGDAVERLLRYKADNDRELYRAMDQLERVQRRRKGEAVCAPLNVNLARRN